MAGVEAKVLKCKDYLLAGLDDSKVNIRNFYFIIIFMNFSFIWYSLSANSSVVFEGTDFSMLRSEEMSPVFATQAIHLKNRLPVDDLQT